MEFIFGESYEEKASLGDSVKLQGQTQEVVACQETGVLMLNVDADELKLGDLKFIKSLGLTISNPTTEKPVALGVDFTEDSWGHKIKKFFETVDDDDDSSFFGSSSGSFLGGSSRSSFGSFGGGFGGFSGGGFSGGGAARGF